MAVPLIAPDLAPAPRPLVRPPAGGAPRCRGTTPRGFPCTNAPVHAGYCAAHRHTRSASPRAVTKPSFAGLLVVVSVCVVLYIAFDADLRGRLFGSFYEEVTPAPPPRGAVPPGTRLQTRR